MQTMSQEEDFGREEEKNCGDFASEASFHFFAQDLSHYLKTKGEALWSVISEETKSNLRKLVNEHPD